MATGTNQCTGCKKRFPVDKLRVVPAGKFHSESCMKSWANAHTDKLLAKARKLTKKAKAKERKQDKQKLKGLMSRAKWYSRLQVLVNQWVGYRDRFEPCCTCGTTSNTIKYDAGHMFTTAARPDIRFELTNIHRQCSIKCNVHGSGMRLEYEKFIIKKYGQKHLDWLMLEKPGLKTQFPNWQDIEAEMVKYRAMLREVGIKPKW